MLLILSIRSIGDAGILVTNQTARKSQEDAGVPFLYVLQAVDLLQRGLLCGVDPIITMPITESLRRNALSMASMSHQMQKTVVMGMANVAQRVSSKKDVLALLIRELQSIVDNKEISPAAQLISLGLDSFGFVSITIILINQWNTPTYWW